MPAGCSQFDQTTQPTTLALPIHMASRLHYSLLFYLPILHLLLNCSASDQGPRPYIVYMGGSRSRNVDAIEDIKFAESAHLQMLSTIIPRQETQRITLGHVYHHAFTGFSAMLTHEEASLLSSHDEIVSVFPDSNLELHTTRSWNFLEEQSQMQSSRHRYVPTATTTDVIIGMIDTGIWPESPSFSDQGIGEVPQRWKGVCMEGSDFKKSDCNRKLIGARHYSILEESIHHINVGATKFHGSPRDHVGHGTHTSSTAAGQPVDNASYYGLAKGTAMGGSTAARIAVYKACSLYSCSGSTILKAMDDAIKDGVDIISISLGNTLLPLEFVTDPIAIGSFHAHQMGVMVVCSAGNGGPEPYTLANAAPWIFTVAASNIDRDFEATVVLGNGSAFQGSAINFSNLTRSSKYPLIFAGDAAAEFTPNSEASNCYPGSLDPKKVAGKIIICMNNYPSIAKKIKKLVVEDAGARGLIYISEVEKGVPFDSGAFPFIQLGETDGFQVLKYINSTRNPTATILATATVSGIKPAPDVADFSSRGPGELTENILKPDIMAPGVAILAANIPESEAGYEPIGKKPSKFVVQSGTSMACPHVSGAAAFIRSVHSSWTPSMIKSALMTTATAANNVRKALTNSTSDFASPHETGSGELSPNKALDPGLVFDTTTKDYLHFLCYHGYSEKKIRSMSNTEFSCPKISTDNLISNINYPSISIGELKRNYRKTVTRYVTNVGSPKATYVASVEAPAGLRVNISPKKMVFQEGVTNTSFKVSFYGNQAPKGYKFGSITWSDGLHDVRVVFAVNIS